MAERAEGLASASCGHPPEKMQRGVLNPEAIYCPTCSTLTFPDGCVERVQITSVRRTKR